MTREQFAEEHGFVKLTKSNHPKDGQKYWNAVKSVVAGDKNIHWYAGVYSQGQWIYNKCSYCKKRQNV